MWTRCERSFVSGYRCVSGVDVEWDDELEVEGYFVWRSHAVRATVVELEDRRAHVGRAASTTYAEADEIGGRGGLRVWVLKCERGRTTDAVR